MKQLILILTCGLVSSCATWGAMSESEKQTAMWVAGIVVTAYVVSDNSDSTTIIREEFCEQHGNRGCGD